MLPPRAIPAAFAALLLGALAMTDTASAQDRPTERTVTVSATGSVSAAPDVAHISAGVVSEAATARDAMDQNNKAMRALIDGLKSIGLDAKDIQTTHVGVEPKHQNYRDGQPPKIVGYRVVNQVRVVQRNIARLGETLDKCISLGANQLGGVSFEVSTAETLKDEARRRAMANARRRAELYATAAGVGVDRVLSIAETTASGPRPMGVARMAMAEPVPIEPGEQSLTVTVHVTWSLK